MTIQQRPIFSNIPRTFEAPQNTPPTPPQQPTPTPPEQPEQPPQDDYNNGDPINEKNFSWLDLGKGIMGGTIGAVVEGVGIGASSLVRAPQVGYETGKAIIQSKMLGPVLKTTLIPVVAAATVLAPFLAVVGGTLYGAFEGFTKGVEQNPLAAAPAGLDTIKKFHTELAGKAVEYVQEAAQASPESPEEVLEIKVIEGAKGLVGAVGAAAVTSVGGAVSTALNLPEGIYKTSKAVWQSDVALPLKVGGQAGVLLLAAGAVPLAGLGGALYGLGTGAMNGYKKGVVESFSQAGKDVSEYHKAVDKALDEL